MALYSTLNPYKDGVSSIELNLERGSPVIYLLKSLLFIMHENTVDKCTAAQDRKRHVRQLASSALAMARDSARAEGYGGARKGDDTFDGPILRYREHVRGNHSFLARIDYVVKIRR
ncbi:hypothetical protein ACJJTC_003298 [Scirpophaga incertulas]